MADVHPIGSRKLSALDRANACNAGLSHHQDEMARLMTDTKWVIPNVIASGTSNVMVGNSSSGKSLWAMFQIWMGINNGDIKAENVYYWNEDDYFESFRQKAKLAGELGFKMISSHATGGDIIKSPKEINEIMAEVARDGDAAGKIFILDTLKKFINPMDKNRFPVWVSNYVKPFTMAGGTLIVLAHTNKNKGDDGDAVYSGVADVLQDFDVLYIGQAQNAITDDWQKTVWKVEKQRGPIKRQFAVSFRQYGEGEEVDYRDLLNTVKVSDHDTKKDWARINRENFDRRWKDGKRYIDIALANGVTLNQAQLKDTLTEIWKDSANEHQQAIGALTHVEYLTCDRSATNNAIEYCLNGNYDADKVDWAGIGSKFTKARGERRKKGEL